MASFFLGSPIVDIHMIETHLRAGVSRSPYSDAPRSSLPFGKRQRKRWREGGREGGRERERANERERERL
jgi:hypothetical protein